MGPFPANDSGQRFSSTRYTTKTKSGIEVENRWLCYSPTLDCVYCHSCWLFADRSSAHFRREWIVGINDWSSSHLTQKMNFHKESSVHHHAIIAEKLWLDKHCLIDEELEKQITAESNFWYEVLQRLVDIIFTLASNNLAFRGHREGHQPSYSFGSGNFLAL